MFGDAMLIAPITSPGKDGYASVRIWLPQGEWYELSTGTLFQGGQILERAFAVDEYPVYVKAGAVLPMYTTDVMNLAANNEAVVVTVFPGEAVRKPVGTANRLIEAGFSSLMPVIAV